MLSNLLLEKKEKFRHISGLAVACTLRANQHQQMFFPIRNFYGKKKPVAQVCVISSVSLVFMRFYQAADDALLRLKRSMVDMARYR